MKRGTSHRASKVPRGAPVVDETLFGSPKPATSKNGTQRKEDPEIVQIVGRDFVRCLRIPQKDPPAKPLILPPDELERITSTSFFIKEEREALKQAYQKKKEEELKSAEEGKNQLIQADLTRIDNQTLTDLDLENRKHSQGLVERANALRMEEEEEIKILNHMIHGAQCQDTLDAQIHERKWMLSQLVEEEKRLDTMMDVERRRAVENMEKIDEKRKQERIKGMQQIHDQIQQRVEEKLMQEEMKELEKRQMRENQERINQEDLKALEKKRLEQQLLQEEIMRINAETMRAKEQRLHEEKLADMRDMEYTKNKQEREAEYEAEQNRIKKEKEFEIARLRAQQEKARDYKSEQDEIRARRNQEIADREWRRKERELAAKKARDEEMLRVARFQQIQNKEHCLSMEAGREKAEVDRVLRAQQEAIAKEKRHEERQHQRAMHHAQAIRQQIKEHELSAMAKRSDIFKEAERLVEEARLRRARLDAIKEKKLKELRATGLSEKYCSEVERKARALKL